MYEINCSYTGYFPLNFPCCEILNQMRAALPKLEEFKVHDSGQWAVK